MISRSPKAPIAIFAFDRLDSLNQTLAALEKSVGFSDSPLFIFSDAPRPETTDEPRVARVRERIREWSKQFGAETIFAETNQGLRRSITSGVSKVLESHDRVVVLEDDIVVSPGFLTFMNGALNAYSERSDIGQVSGYFVPHRSKLPPIGLLRLPACWGWGTWRRAWSCYRDDAANLVNEIRTRDTARFDIESTYGYFDALERNASGSLNTWLVRWYASLYLQNMMTIYPGKSLARNIGFGVGGTNCGPGTTAHTFLNQSIAASVNIHDWTIVGASESDAFASALAGFYAWQQSMWTKPSLKDRAKARLSLLSRYF
jgi:hypothetical protein